MSTRSEPGTCEDCDASLPGIEVLGRMMFFGRWCDSCAPNHPEDLPPAEPEAGPDDVLYDLASLSVNVRKHGLCTLENWSPDESSKPAEAAREFIRDVLAAKWHTEVRGLMLFGDTGTGKTHLATGVIRAALEGGIKARDIVFDRADRLITTVQDTYGSGQTEAVLAKRESATLWVLDDLGREKATPDVLRIITDLLSAREGHPNVITSNYDQGALAKRFEKEEGWVRLSSRLGVQNFRAVKVLGRDRRFVRAI